MNSGHRRYDEPVDQNVGVNKNLTPLKPEKGQFDFSKSEVGSILVDPATMPLYRQAIHFATYVHDGQKRKYNGLPYVTHPIRCSQRVLKIFVNDFDMATAMLLHDAIEDQPARCPAELIEALYGHRVLALVLSLTNPSKERPDLNRSERKALDRKHYAEAHIFTKCLKLIDRIDNLNELSIEKDPGFVLLYCAETQLLLEAMQATTPARPESVFGSLVSEAITLVSKLRNQLGLKSS